jgi:hypothetical protein
VISILHFYICIVPRAIYPTLSIVADLIVAESVRSRLQHQWGEIQLVLAKGWYQHRQWAIRLFTTPKFALADYQRATPVESHILT